MLPIIISMLDPRTVSGWCALSGAAALLIVVVGEPEQGRDSIERSGKEARGPLQVESVRARPYTASKQSSWVALR